jgi:hypothetical protein
VNGLEGLLLVLSIWALVSVSSLLAIKRYYDRKEVRNA